MRSVNPHISFGLSTVFLLVAIFKVFFGFELVAHYWQSRDRQTWYDEPHNKHAIIAMCQLGLAHSLESTITEHLGILCVLSHCLILYTYSTVS